MIHLRFVTAAWRDLASDAVLIGAHDGWATHVEALMPNGRLLGALLEGGVQSRPMDYDKGTATRELYVPLQNVPGEDKFNDFLNAQIGKPYDKLGIVGFVFGRDWHAGDSWFCSELMAA